MINILNTFIELVPVGFFQSLLLAFLALGIMLPFRILNFADLSAEGSYPLGACLAAVLLTQGYPPVLATLMAALGGGIVGLCTAFLHLRFKINSLLAGIILATMLYTVNLRLMGKPNIPLFNTTTIFSNIETSLILKLGMVGLFLILIAGLLFWFFHTEKGQRLRATGFNPVMASAQGVNLTYYIFLGLFLGNALNAISGAMIAQAHGYAEVNMGTGIVVNGLAALMIGEVLIGTRTMRHIVLAPILGTLVYQQLQGVVLVLGLQPADFKFMTGLFIIAALMLRRTKNNVQPSLGY